MNRMRHHCPPAQTSSRSYRLSAEAALADPGAASVIVWHEAAARRHGRAPPRHGARSSMS